jgi:iron-sulfur cluster repair protein YtfE (RIC family)
MGHRASQPLGMRGYDSITAYLSADHARLDQLFDDCIELAGSHALDEVRVEFGRFHDGMKRHIALEESIVFPVFDERTGIVGPLTVMRSEHRLIAELLGRGRLALDHGDLDAFNAVVPTLKELLQAHNRKEERILYPRTDAALADEERRDLAARLERS